MVAKRALDYQLSEIFTSEKFINNIFKASKITSATNHESSFCVYGDFHKYVITKPLQEDVDRVLIDKIFFDEEKDDSLGIRYSKKGYGFWKPENSLGIVFIHFHPD